MALGGWRGGLLVSTLSVTRCLFALLLPHALNWWLGKAGTDEDNVARKIGHRLHSRWADSNAMGLIVAEVSLHPCTPPPSSHVDVFPKKHDPVSVLSRMFRLLDTLGYHDRRRSVRLKSSLNRPSGTGRGRSLDAVGSLPLAQRCLKLVAASLVPLPRVTRNACRVPQVTRAWAPGLWLPGLYCFR